MKPRSHWILSGAVSMFALLSAPELVQAQSSPSGQGPTAGASGHTGKAERSASDQMSVAAARSIVGDRIQDRNGKDLGTVEYLLIGVDDARVRYAVVSPEANGSDRLAPVPWTALDRSKAGEDVLTTDRETFAKQKRYQQSQIIELTEPSLITQIYEVWAPVAQQQAQKSGKQQTDRPEAGQAQKGAAQKSETQGGNQGSPHFLVGRDVVATILPPVFRTNTDMRGSEVYSSDGQQYGEIDNLMIDLDRGRLAYVQVGHGGFLGMGEEITPVPFEALSYDQERNGYRLGKSEAELEKVQSFARSDQPTSIKTSDLKKLYESFGVHPYWQEKS